MHMESLRARKNSIHAELVAQVIGSVGPLSSLHPCVKEQNLDLLPSICPTIKKNKRLYYRQ